MHTVLWPPFSRVISAVDNDYTFRILGLVCVVANPVSSTISDSISIVLFFSRERAVQAGAELLSSPCTHFSSQQWFSPFPKSLIICLTDYCYPSDAKWYSLWFWLWFPWWLMILNIFFCMLTGHLFILIGAKWIQIICLFLVGLFLIFFFTFLSLLSFLLSFFLPSFLAVERIEPKTHACQASSLPLNILFIILL